MPLAPNALKKVGTLSGMALAPWTALGSYIRQARVFHPSGLMLCGRVIAQTPRVNDVDVTDQESLLRLGELVQGGVVARFSGAFWKKHEWPDVLGCALRCSGTAAIPRSSPAHEDQDLLLATVRHPMTTLLAAITTDVSDYLSNDYYGVSPFTAPALDRFKLRLVSMGRGGNGATREAKLLAELDRNPLRFQLEASPLRGGGYRAIAALELDEPLIDDQDRWQFDPFRTGRGIQPVGFVQNLRRAAYAASREARPG